MEAKEEYEEPHERVNRAEFLLLEEYEDQEDPDLSCMEEVSPVIWQEHLPLYRYSILMQQDE